MNKFYPLTSLIRIKSIPSGLACFILPSNKMIGKFNIIKNICLILQLKHDERQE